MSMDGERWTTLNAFEKSNKVKGENCPIIGKVLKIKFRGMCISTELSFWNSYSPSEPQIVIYICFQLEYVWIQMEFSAK